jgi:hypothetical protein
MSSNAKAAANRQNALKSTGPRTNRGKSKSRLNAVTHGIYAATKVLPGEDESAYREMEKALFQHFAPIGPVENMLVRQIVGETWRLERIDRAEFALLMQLRDGQIVRFLRSLNDDEMVYVKSAYTNNLDDQIQQRREQIESEIRGEPEFTRYDEYTEPEEYGEMPDEDVKSRVDACLIRVLDIDSTILAGLVPKSEGAPQACLDRERRATMRACFSYVAKLQELQESRLTVKLSPQAQLGAARNRTADKCPRPLAAQVANQNHLKLDGDVAEK